MYRRDRDGRKKDGGGVLIAVLKTIKSKRMVHWESQCEDLWITIELPFMKSNRQMALCAVYLPPPVLRTNLENFLDSCNAILERTGLDACIIGDFNLSIINWNLVSDSANTYTPPGISHILLDFTHMHKFAQLNSITNVSGRILDLVLTNLPSVGVTAAPNPLSIVDSLHPPIEILLKANIDQRLPYNPQNTKPNFFKLDYENICKVLNEVNWNKIFEGVSDVNEMLRIFYDKIMNVIQLHGPSKPSSRRKKYPPWFDKNLIRALREKEKIRNRHKIYKNPMDKIEFNLLSKRCANMATCCYNNYIKNIENEISRNPNRFWAYIKDKRGGSSSFPVTMTNGTTVSSDGFKICEMFASYFSSVFSDAKTTNCTPVSEYLHNMKNNSLPLTAPVIDQESLLNKLKSLDIRKGAGPDGIPPIFISTCASALVPPLLIIFNKSLSTGVFPDS